MENISFEQTYQKIKTYLDSVPKTENYGLESFDVVKSVNEHRNFWKPKKVKILLLAESHVHTLNEEHDQIMKYNNFPELNGCPTNYVKLVYCLGYGEKEFVSIKKNPGTWQYWKVFISCVFPDYDSKFRMILNKDTPSLNQRIKNKILILEKMKEQGIWLVDASIVSVYKNEKGEVKKPRPKVMKNILQITWRSYILKIIQEVNPEKIIVIGRTIKNHLQKELTETEIYWLDQNQPNARISSDEIKESYRIYSKECN